MSDIPMTVPTMPPLAERSTEQRDALRFVSSQWEALVDDFFNDLYTRAKTPEQVVAMRQAVDHVCGDEVGDAFLDFLMEGEG